MATGTKFCNLADSASGRFLIRWQAVNKPYSRSVDENVAAAEPVPFRWDTCGRGHSLAVHSDDVPRRKTAFSRINEAFVGSLGF